MSHRPKERIKGLCNNNNKNRNRNRNRVNKIHSMSVEVSTVVLAAKTALWAHFATQTVLFGRRVWRVCTLLGQPRRWFAGPLRGV